MALGDKMNVQPTFGKPVQQVQNLAPVKDAVSLASAIGTAVAAAMPKTSDNTLDLTSQLNDQKAVYKIPPYIKVKITNTAGTGVGNKKVYLFNNNTLQPLVTDGGKAGSLSYDFSDGFSGKFLEQLFRSCNQGAGLKIYGMNLSAYAIDGSGVRTADNDVIIGASMAIVNHDGLGNEPVEVINLSDIERNDQYKDGRFRVKAEFFIHALNQMSLTMTGDAATSYELNITLLTQPLSDVK